MTRRDQRWGGRGGAGTRTPPPGPGGVSAPAHPAKACGREARVLGLLAPQSSASSPAPSHLRPLDAMTHGRFADVAAAQGPEDRDVGCGCGGGGGWGGGPRGQPETEVLSWTFPGRQRRRTWQPFPRRDPLANGTGKDGGERWGVAPSRTAGLGPSWRHPRWRRRGALGRRCSRGCWKRPLGRETFETSPANAPRYTVGETEAQRKDSYVPDFSEQRIFHPNAVFPPQLRVCIEYSLRTSCHIVQVWWCDKNLRFNHGVTGRKTRRVEWRGRQVFKNWIGSGGYDPCDLSWCKYLYCNLLFPVYGMSKRNTQQQLFTQNGDVWETIYIHRRSWWMLEHRINWYFLWMLVI